MQALIKLLIELGPLVTFFAVNSKFGIFAGTAAFMVATLIAMIAARLTAGRIPVMLWVSGAVVLIFGGATLIFENELFIKLKPTILYALFSGALFFGLWTRKPYLKIVMGSSFPTLSDEGWALMTRRWAWFFLTMAGLNEVVWRLTSTETWITSKIVLFLPLSFVFAMLQLPLIQRHTPADDSDKPAE
ncbi:septation protein A [Govanella unica]|uniref:Inner membrane-spanning protein YciB n=1 Tax=Govanella unica TaxID=2975056 RepID=A0A9X3TVV5_9PROT|nr:septation protein A [Govania unica]MDA5192718.1 septation protein A [Govania unica]